MRASFMSSRVPVRLLLLAWLALACWSCASILGYEDGVAGEGGVDGTVDAPIESSTGDATMDTTIPPEAGGDAGTDGPFARDTAADQGQGDGDGGIIVPCVPNTCGTMCGAPPSGCDGGVLDCGPCSNVNEMCSAPSFTCVAADAGCTPMGCVLGQCGTNVPNGCGMTQSCSPLTYCGGPPNGCTNPMNGKCCTATCPPGQCSGTYNDPNCGGNAVQCNQICLMPESCSGNFCRCTPLTCATVSCSGVSQPDGCGGQISCPCDGGAGDSGFDAGADAGDSGIQCYGCSDAGPSATCAGQNLLTCGQSACGSYCAPQGCTLSPLVCNPGSNPTPQQYCCP